MARRGCHDTELSLGCRPIALHHGQGSAIAVTAGVTVVYANLTADDDSVSFALPWLTDPELIRSRRFRNDPARHRYILCRASLRAILCGQLGCDNRELTIEYAEFGKPYAIVDGQPASISFNVSHSGSHGLIALSSKGEVGVDIEELPSRCIPDHLIDAVLTPEERAGLPPGDQAERASAFLQLWTVKEALVKASGEGLSRDFSTFEVPKQIRLGEDSCVFAFPDAPDTAWMLVGLSNPEFAAALAYGADPFPQENTRINSRQSLRSSLSFRGLQNESLR